RILGRGLPHRSAAVLPALLAVLPRFIARLAGARDRVGAPRRLAGVEVRRLDEAPNAVFAPGSADDGKVADDEGWHGKRFGDRRVGDLALPGDFAGRLVDREHAAIKRIGNHLVLPQRNATVVDAAAGHVASPRAVSTGIHLPLDDALLAGRDVDRV